LSLLGAANDPLLNSRNLLDRHLTRQIATIDQERVGRCRNGTEISQAVPILDLGDHEGVGTKCLAYFLQVRSAAREGQRHVVDTHIPRHCQDLPILLRQGRQGDAALDGDRFVLADLTAGEDAHDDPFRLDLDHLEQGPTVDSEEVTFLELVDYRARVQVEAASVSGNECATDPHDAA
jgi:hypothetical protein